ncbi:MAG: hypothetical protein ACP5MV_00880 [Candidatus Parvarchaeum sp.]
MDLLLEGILIAIMMAIILFFVVYEYSAFFAPKSSISYYNSLVSMADSACTSIQTASNVQFSSPSIFVFQMYDTPGCNSILSSNTYIFSPNSAVLSSLDGNYNLCYANISDPVALGVSSGNQYFLESTAKGDVNFYLPKEYAFSGSANMSDLALYNQISTSGIVVNSSSTFSLILNSSSVIASQNYTFYLQEYSNNSINLNAYFNGQSTCSRSYSDLTGIHSLSLVSPCQQEVHNITLVVSIPGNLETNFQVNVTAKSNYNPTFSYLSQQCTNLVTLVKEGTINNGSIVCQPILCGGNSFYLADQSNRPFLGLYSKSFTFLGVQSGVNDLQLVNSYSEQLVNGSLMDETVFVEGGLPFGASWSVTYDGDTKSSTISLTGSGDVIAFSEPPGSYGFSIQSSSVTENHIVRTYNPSPSSGTAKQGSYVGVDFKST